MKVVFYYENGMEAKTLSDEGVELLRQSAEEYLKKSNEYLEDIVDDEGEGEDAEQIRKDIVILEQLRDALTPKEVYEKAPAWRAIAEDILNTKEA
jgi:polyhydroxyalkanoate synthesis regulator phasin